MAETVPGAFIGWVGDTRITWIHFPNPMIEPFIETPEVQGLKIASLADIVIMKWNALANLGSVKDFLKTCFPFWKRNIQAPG